MATYHVSNEAIADLDAIWDYLAGEGSTQADKLLDGVFETCGHLADNPHIGRNRPELKEGLRSFPVKPYLIFYTVEDPQKITIRRVIHGSRDLEKQFEQ